MKIKELVEKLLSIDPSGECEVLINNNDIDYLSNDPMYYDGHGYLIKKRDNYHMPTQVMTSVSGEKINIIPINVYKVYKQKILENEGFLKITTEGNCFTYESTRIFFNKLITLYSCKQYLETADEKIYYYKNNLLIKISSEIQKEKNDYNKNLIGFIEKNFYEIKERKIILINLVNKIYQENDNIIFKLPKYYNLTNDLILETYDLDSFRFTIKSNNITNYTFTDNTSKESIIDTDIKLDTFDFKSLSNSWNIFFDKKVKNFLSF